MHPWGLYLRTAEHNKIQLLIVSKDGTETYMEPMTAAEDLVNSLRIDYSLYRGSVYQLDRHPLFKPKLNLSMLEYWDYVSKAQMCVDHLAEIDPVTHFFLKNKMDAELKTEDDGSASFLLYSGRRIQKILEEPLWALTRIQMVMDAGFAKTERSTQRERFRALDEEFPELFTHFFHARLIEEPAGDAPFGIRMEYGLSDLIELRMLELQLYFRQSARIARCEYCGDYFIPKTRKQTLYCDRKFGNRTCKTLGPRALRRIQESKDNALEIYSTLHHRMEARFDRYYNRREEDSFSAYKLDIFQYTEWCDQARKARQQYMEGKITAEELVLKIDKYREFPEFVFRRSAIGEQKATLQQQAEWLDEDDEEPEYGDEYEDEYENGYGYPDLDEDDLEDD